MYAVPVPERGLGNRSRRGSAVDREGILFGLGNPLLDISADVTEEFLKKYGLEPNNAILAEDKHKAMYEEMVNKFDVSYTAGGATQNTMRVAQWLIGIPKATTFMGCIGKGDRFAKVLEDNARKDGLEARYQYTDTEPTGTCGVLVTNKGKNRSLCAYLGAANCFTVEHLRVPENRDLVEKAKFFYISGFPLTVSPEAMLEVARVAAASLHKRFIMNLSAPFLCEFFKEQMMSVMPYVDILFGNEAEFATFARVHAFLEDDGEPITDLHDVARRVSALPKENGGRARMVIVTQGSDPTIVCESGKVREFPTNSVKQCDIVDTNGAGDAFVGGFLAELIQDRRLEECIRNANYAANYIIKQSGVVLPKKNEETQYSVCF